MTPLDLSAALAAEHRRDLLAEVRHDRLAALVSCCRPATWRRAARRATAAVRSARSWLRRDYLGRLETCTCS